MQNQFDIIVVDPNEIAGEGLRRVLTERDFDVCGLYRDAAGVEIPAAESTRFTVGIITAGNDAAALEICTRLHQRWPTLKIVIMGHSCHLPQVVDAFRGGADGYVSKDISCAGLAETLKLVALGEKMIPSQVVYELIAPRNERAFSQAGSGIEDAHVSEREVEILRGLIAGEPNKVISRRLGITEATVKVHVKSILRKLNVMNRTQAAIWAVSRGLEARDRYPESEQPFEAGIDHSDSFRSIGGLPTLVRCGMPGFAKGGLDHSTGHLEIKVRS